MIRKTINTIKRFHRYKQLIGFRDALYFIFNELSKRERIKSITLANARIFVRTSTPDISVAINSLVDEEYSNIKSSSPAVIIDAGANIGTSAMFFAIKYPNAKIFAIEPEQGNYNMLQKNTRNYKNIVPIKAALWGENDNRIIKNRFTGHWGYTVSDTDNKTEPVGQQVECITLGNLMKQHNITDCIDILKMDIEGGEKSVFEKAEEWIDKVRIISVELHDRICMGSDRAFYLATREFACFEKKGEKITAYRELHPTNLLTD